ncbi:hypothetical protein PLICRDRAFT_237035 [Plicaturopsis crispa FD-325 SS-3]|nr:hypothetical protein PLICRDRAFT_237035 [Plicaturopsis crispa FD-325 SS-3]
MSISVEDLVASLSSNHIGQEALDLAALQAQLAQTLFAQPSSSAQQQQPCNTPTATSSFAYSPICDSRRRNSSVSSQRPSILNEEIEDERMVEDILTPTPSSPSNYHPHHHHHSHHHHHQFGGHDTYSSFASTDPFFIAQLQADKERQAQAQNFFAQAGKPAHGSPFMQQQQSQTQGRQMSEDYQRWDAHAPFDQWTGHAPEVAAYNHVAAHAMFGAFEG